MLAPVAVFVTARQPHVVSTPITTFDKPDYEKLYQKTYELF
jgi:hypothetical protein